MTSLTSLAVRAAVLLESAELLAKCGAPSIILLDGRQQLADAARGARILVLGPAIGCAALRTFCMSTTLQSLELCGLCGPLPCDARMPHLKRLHVSLVYHGFSEVRFLPKWLRIAAPGLEDLHVDIDYFLHRADLSGHATMFVREAALAFDVGGLMRLTRVSLPIHDLFSLSLVRHIEAGARFEGVMFKIVKPSGKWTDGNGVGPQTVAELFRRVTCGVLLNMYKTVQFMGTRFDERHELWTKRDTAYSRETKMAAHALEAVSGSATVFVDFFEATSSVAVACEQWRACDPCPHLLATAVADTRGVRQQALAEWAMDAE